MAERGLYQQPESDAAPQNAAVERAADGDADKSYQGHLNRMVNAVDAEVKAARKGDRAASKGRNVVVRASVKAEKAALKAQADIVDNMKSDGYAQLVAEGMLNVGRAVRRAKLASVNGAIASNDVPDPTDPNSDAKRIRIKSDGKGAVQLFQSAARNGNVNRFRDTEAGAFLLRNTEAGKAVAKGLKDVKESFTPLEDDHAGRKADGNDRDDPTVIAAHLNAPNMDGDDWFG